ncbi:Na+/H+ antiporter subunit E [Amorphus orientalis]|uniref:Multicomponent Na+:H+ antiporter subunit E n=1 Tax=Amorphus orientalis TaxID=649198 RepID=A0AAE3VN65_9HYPH|nr:Na+/H+ antiporter subunit E [Amorphus orientalis]MDQ0315106.1 multicomponent Na+:H+ antiporter subunit E [Amorphus orientalis]
MPVLLANVLLAVAWGAVTGSFEALNLLFGFVLAAMALWLIREQIGTRGSLGRTWRGLSLAGLFLWELVMSSVRVAIIVLSPRRDLRPAIIAYPLTVDRDFEITLLANLITLTPGTLSIDVSEDRETLFIHCIDVPDPDAAITDIKNGFERKIMETFR